MRRINNVISEIACFVDQHELENFIARGWVRPLRDEIDYIFDEADIARIKLICELHIEMNFDNDAVDIILSLMDQLYESRSSLNRVMESLKSQPNDVCDAVIESLKKL